MSVVSTPASATATGTATAVTARPARSRARTALLALQIVLALFYGVASAAPKLLGIDAAADSFDRIGFGDWFMYLTGALELAGAVALLIPVLYQVAAVAMIGLMIGATVTQITVFDGDNAATPIILILPLALIAWARRDSTKALLALVRGAVART
ncbi:DoxX family protein [Streptomyces sp. NPDC088910]|uniref:DoxX family protein n=1 Tax=Streptomyces sp. NPDC088910 TaxID=3365911 RepID=UPI00382FA533